MQFVWKQLPRLAGAALAALCAGPVLAAGANMITNGSFESPAYDAPGVYSGGGDGWIKTFQGPVVIVRGNIKDNNRNRYGRTPFGQQYLGIDPRSSTGFIGGDSQEVPGFVAGKPYLLTFYAADSDGGKAPKLDVTLSDGSDTTYEYQLFDLPVGGPYSDFIEFKPYHLLFRAKVSGTIVLTMRNMGDNITGTDPGSISIDNVSIVPLFDAATGIEDAQAALPGPSSAFVR